MLLSTGSNEIQQLRWNSSLGLVFGADSLKPRSSKCRSMRSSHGAIQQVLSDWLGLSAQAVAALKAEGLAATESLAHVLTLGLPPLVQDGDVGADGEVPDAHVEE